MNNGINGTVSRKSWSKDSYKDFPIRQQPTYTDENELKTVLTKVRQLPPLVHHKEIQTIKKNLLLAQENKNFLVQIGDCAERFLDAREDIIQSKIDFYNTISQIYSYVLDKKVITLGRIAGQYAKPRTNDFEVYKGNKIDIYRGDIINDFDPEGDRKANPNKILDAYYNSMTTINQIQKWNSFGDKSSTYYMNKYSNIDFSYNVMLKEMLANMYDNLKKKELDQNVLYTTHEGLLLCYEECFVRKVDDKYYDLSAHVLWIGERTNNLDEAHIEFFRGVENPIGIKISTKLSIENIISIIDLINPSNEKGKIILHLRLGIKNLSGFMESLCQEIKKRDLNVIFVCDPMHGNTKTLNNFKVRLTEDISNEIKQIATILFTNGFFISGVHFESTFENVTECIGGTCVSINEADIGKNYNTYCDPRLNMLQTMEIAFETAEHIKNLSKPRENGINGHYK